MKIPLWVQSVQDAILYVGTCDDPEEDCLRCQTCKVLIFLRDSLAAGGWSYGLLDAKDREEEL